MSNAVLNIYSSDDTLQLWSVVVNSRALFVQSLSAGK